MNLHRALKLLELQLLLLKLLLLLNMQLLLLGLQLRCAQVVVLLLMLRTHLAQEPTELPVARSRRQERLAGRVVGARAVTRRGSHRGDRHSHWHHGYHGRNRGQRGHGVLGVAWCWERRRGGCGALGEQVWRDDDASPDENEGNDWSGDGGCR